MADERCLRLSRVNHWVYGFSEWGAELVGCRGEAVEPAFWLRYQDEEDSYAVAIHPDFPEQLAWSEAPPGFVLDLERSAASHPDGREVQFPETPKRAKLSVLRSGGRWWLHVVPEGRDAPQRLFGFDEVSGHFEEPLSIAPTVSTFAATGSTLCSVRGRRVVVERAGRELAGVDVDVETVASPFARSSLGLAAGPTAFAIVENHAADVRFSRITCLSLAGDSVDLRSFLLAARQPAEVAMGPAHLVLRSGDDVVVAALSDLDALPPGELAVEIFDVAREAPEWAGARHALAQVAFVGPTTGAVLLQVDATRKRWVNPPLHCQVGEPCWVLEQDDLKVTQALLARGAQPFVQERRIFSAWSHPQVAEELASKRQANEARAEAKAGERSRARQPIPGAWRTSVVFPVTVEVAEGPDEGKPLKDPAKLALLDGLVETGGSIHLGVVGAVGGSTDGLLELRPVLRFSDRRKRPGVEFTLEFWTSQEPSDARAFLEVAEQILESGWGRNYQFSLPEELGDFRVLVHRSSGKVQDPVGPVGP
jgi:hypothetical protein